MRTIKECCDFEDRHSGCMLSVKVPFFSTLEAYWAFVGNTFGLTHVNQFVSVHKAERLNESIYYRILSPMCLVDHTTGKRPAFEQLLFSSKAACVLHAKMIARSYIGGHVVDCAESL